MKTQDKLLLYGFAFFSAITSFLFIFYAVTVNCSGTAPYWLKIFSYVAGGYGLFNIYIISWAWRSRVDWTIKANMVIGVCFFGVFLMNTIRDGFSGGLITVGTILGLAAVLWINWFTIKKLCQREE